MFFVLMGQNKQKFLRTFLRCFLKIWVPLRLAVSDEFVKFNKQKEHVERYWRPSDHKKYSEIYWVLLQDASSTRTKTIKHDR